MLLRIVRGTHSVLDTVLHPDSSAHRSELHLTTVARFERLFVGTINGFLFLLINNTIVVRLGVLLCSGSLTFLLR